MTKLERNKDISAIVANIAGVVGQLLVGGGLIVTILLGLRGLEENQLDRQQQQAIFQQTLKQGAELQKDQQRFEQQPSVYFEQQWHQTR